MPLAYPPIAAFGKIRPTGADGGSPWQSFDNHIGISDFGALTPQLSYSRVESQVRGLEFSIRDRNCIHSRGARS
jgi:hypothetical protein